MRLSRQTLFEAAASEAKRFGQGAPGPLHFAFVVARTEPLRFERAFGADAAAIIRRALVSGSPASDPRAVASLLEAWETGDLDAFLAALAPLLPAEIRPSEPEAPEGWAPGDVLAGTYEVLGVAGAGAMGTVHRVRHLQWGIDLAVKSPKGDVDLTAFEREADTWIGLGLHPHVCVCHYVRRLDGTPRLFAEFAGRGSLAGCIRDRTLYAGLPRTVLERLLDLAVQFARGLAHAHDRGVVHQDVKPENVLLDNDGVAKLTDFGIARAAAPGSLVTVGALVRPYCSPEQAATERWLDATTDVWSFAVSVLALFAGGPPSRRGPDAGQGLARIAATQNPSLPRLPRALADLLGRCLQPAPTERPAMRDVARELEQVYGRTLGHAYPRQLPEEGLLRAGELSNHALSMLDLNQPEEADRLFEEALRHDPEHPQATYNRGLRQWRRALITDDELVRRLTAVGGSDAGELLARVHLERGDPEAAQPLLDAAQARGLDVSQARTAAAATRPMAGLMGSVQSQYGGIASITIADGLALTGSRGWSGTGESWDLRTGRLVHTLPSPLPEAADGHIGAALSADGRLALVGCMDGSLTAWDLSDQPRRLRHLDASGIDVAAIALAADAPVLVAGGSRDTIVWDLSRETPTGRRVGIPLVTALALSGNGQVAVSGHIDGRVQAWDTADGRVLGAVQAEWTPLAVAVARYSVAALVGGIDGSVGVWDIRGRRWTVRPGHTNLVMSVGLAADARLGVTGGYDGALRVWDCATARCVRTLDADAEVSSVALAADGEIAISGDINGTLRAWQLRIGPQAPAPWALNRPRPIWHAVDADARFRATLAEVDCLLAAGSVAAAAERLRGLRSEPAYERDPLVVERWRAVARRARRAPPLRVWDWLSLHEDRRAAAGVTSIALSGDGAWALTTGGGAGPSLWGLDDGRRVSSLDNPLIGHVALAPDGQRALTGAHDGRIQLWDAPTSSCLWTLEAHTDSVESVGIALGGRLGVSAGRDNVARLWDLDAGACLASWQAGVKLCCVAIQDDGSRVVAGCGDGALRVWRFDADGAPELLGHTQAVSAIALTRDGRQAVTAGFDHTARVWDLGAGECTRVLHGHGGSVLSIAVDVDGTLAMTGSWDRCVKLWDLASGACRATLAFPGAAMAVAITPDGRLGAAGGADLVTRVWQLDWECEFPGDSGWDEDARWVLDRFARMHPGEHLDVLFRHLEDAGFGWMDHDSVRRELARG